MKSDRGAVLGARAGYRGGADTAGYDGPKEQNTTAESSSSWGWKPSCETTWGGVQAPPTAS